MGTGGVPAARPIPALGPAFAFTRGPGCEVGVREEEELLCHEEGRGVAGAEWGQEQGVSASWTRSWQSARRRCSGTGPRQGLCSCRGAPLALALGPPIPGAVPPAAVPPRPAGRCSQTQ